MHPDSLPQLGWLALFCSPPLLIALLFALRTHRPKDIGRIRIGNPMLKPGALPTPQPAELHPLLHLTRTQSDASLRALILGLRHMPLKDTAFILRRCQQSTDPELQIYAQSILQEKQDHLQTSFTRLLSRATPDAPAILASCIEAALTLVASPLTPDPERTAVLRKVLPKVESVRASGLAHPRAVFAAGRCCLLVHQIGHAAALCARLPKGSPLHDSLTVLVIHEAAIHHPPPSLTSGYSIH